MWLLFSVFFFPGKVHMSIHSSDLSSVFFPKKKNRCFIHSIDFFPRKCKKKLFRVKKIRYLWVIINESACFWTKVELFKNRTLQFFKISLKPVLIQKLMYLQRLRKIPRGGLLFFYANFISDPESGFPIVQFDDIKKFRNKILDKLHL